MPKTQYVKAEIVESPLVKGLEAVFEYELSTLPIIDLYQKRYQMDVSRFFQEDAIRVYRCPESGYRFYYPYRMGDSRFYEELQRFDWYYLPWKWEYEVCLGLLGPGQKVLEIGCGKGDFIKKAFEDKQANCVGLELNESVRSPLPEVQVFHQTIEDFSEAHPESFDVVCSFQVLEHIADIRSFLEAAVKTLKSKGILVLCVPNNASFLRYDPDNILNQPPHHIGLWDETSLRNLEKYFPIQPQNIFFEPLPKYHFDYYMTVMVRKSAGKTLAGMLSRALNLGLNRVLHPIIQKRADRIRGQSILGVYRKL
ncbi:MAG: class I SAM-dependent methyltransferase [Microscillaceae bacterium]|nr:class I SAM-dependent methyltransferase [Microscillaceae bacterium]